MALLVDAHAHVATRAHWKRDAIRSWFEPLGLDPSVFDVDPAALARDYVGCGVSAGVVLALDARRGIGVHVPNEYVARVCAESNGRLIGYASVDPLGEDPLSALDRAVDQLGLHGVKLAPTYQHFHPLDPRARAVYEHCSARRIPVLMHQGGSVNAHARTDYQSSEFIDGIAELFPELSLTVAHLGVPEEDAVMAILTSRLNVHADVSGLDDDGFGPGLDRVVQLVRQAVDAGVATKLFWGSDSPWSLPSRSLARTRARLHEGLGLAPVEARAVSDGLFGDNFLAMRRRLGRPLTIGDP